MKQKIKRPICSDCGVPEGQFHKPGCDMEVCPFCGRQLVTCDCVYEKLNIDASPGTWAYNHGLTDAQADKWEAMLTKKGKIPYTQPILLCVRCGETFPDFFMDPKWDFYVPPNLQKEVLCKDCYNDMKKLFPNGWRNPVPAKNIPAKSSYKTVGKPAMKKKSSQTRPTLFNIG